MSLALIEESAKEARRLAIAGSPLAVGDFRLKKLVSPLEQAGAKVPVFAQVAKALSEVVNGTEAESATRLLNLSTLLNAILYTQGQSSAAGDFQKLETYPASCVSTRTTARVLKPLAEALTSSGSGRFETVKTAVERGAFNDFRLIDPAIKALGDNYPELADLVAEKILPNFGSGIVPRLRETFDVKGKRADARKLAVMHRLDPAGTLELCKQALEDGSVEVRAAAVGCLGSHEDCLPLVMQQTSAKSKEVRAAALEALAEHDRPEVTKLFTELVKGKALDLLVRPFRTLKNRQVLNSLLDEARAVFAAVLKNDAEQIARFGEILECLSSRRDAEVESLLLDCLAQAEALVKVKAPKNVVVTAGSRPGLTGQLVISGADLLANVAVLVYQFGSPKALEAILARRESLPPAVFPQVLRTAIRVWPPEKVFAEFSPLLRQGKGAAKDAGDQVVRLIASLHWDESSRFNPMSYGEGTAGELQLLKSIPWDSRWLDAAIEADQATAVCCLARPNHKAAVNYILKLGDAKKTSDAGMTVRALVRCQYPKVTDHFLELVSKRTKTASYLDYELQFLFENAKHLPPADLPKLDAFAAKLDEKFVDAYLVAIDPLRRPNPTN